MKITNVNDYVKKVHEKFPELTESEIKRILEYALKMILYYVRLGNDVSIIMRKFFFFIGEIPNNSLSVFQKYCYKLSKRINHMFFRTKSQWDGYYYFSRSENQYIEYLKQNKKKKKVFKDVFLYKLLEEVKVHDSSAPYIFRLSEDKTKWYKKYYSEIKTDKAELIIHRDPLNMHDLMVSNNKYKYIQYGTGC